MEGDVKGQGFNPRWELLIFSLCYKFESVMWFLGSRWYQKKAHIGFFGASSSLFFLFCLTSFSGATDLEVDFVSK